MMRDLLFRKAIFTILFMLGTFSVYSQNQVEKWIATPEDEYIESIEYLYLDFLFLTVHRGEVPETYQENFTNYTNVLYKSDFNLEFSDSLLLDEVGGYDVLVKDFLKVDPTGLLFWAKALHKNTQDEQLCLLWFDENLNLVNSSVLGSADTMEVISDAIVSSDGNLLFVGSTSITALQGSYILWELDADINEVKKIIFGESVAYDPTIIEVPGTNKFHMCAGFETFQFDNGLNFEMLIDFPANINIHPQNQNKLINDFEYIKTGLYISAPIPGSPWEMDLAFSLMDENASVTDTYTFGIPDSIDTPGKLDFINTDTIYYGGTRNLTNNPVQDSWVSLFTTNLQGEVLEHRFWGGGGQYQFSDLTALPTGGFLMAVTRWDYLNFPEGKTRDIRLITENYGNPITGNANITFKKDNFQLYPNPGNNIIQIKAVGNGLYFRLLDVHSRIILETDFDETAEIEISGLRPGIYFYEVSEGKKILQTGKWIKQ
jgi:hypothetical protein